MLVFFVPQNFCLSLIPKAWILKTICKKQKYTLNILFYYIDFSNLIDSK